MLTAQSEIQKRLFGMRDEVYRDFLVKLMPTVPRETVIGVRTPVLRAYATEIAGTPAAAAFLQEFPHVYYEENNLHAFLLEKTRDFADAIRLLDEFLPYVNNWATCDSMKPRYIGRHLREFSDVLDRWLLSPHPYAVRFAIEMRMNFYLGEEYSQRQADEIAALRREEYYIRMMVAWYFATALAKRYDDALPYLEGHRLDDFTHQKTISKACESYRISPEQKAYLKTLRKIAGDKHEANC